MKNHLKIKLLSPEHQDFIQSVIRSQPDWLLTDAGDETLKPDVLIISHDHARLNVDLFKPGSTPALILKEKNGISPEKPELFRTLSTDFVLLPADPDELLCRINALAESGEEIRLAVGKVKLHCDALSGSLYGIFNNLPGLLELFSDMGDRSLILFLDYLKDKTFITDDARYIRIKNEITESLKAEGIEHADLFGDKLAQMGYSGSLKEFMPFFHEMDRHPASVITLQNMAVLWKHLALLRTEVRHALDACNTD